jgi:thiamine biosynthesis lipoprotein
MARHPRPPDPELAASHQFDALGTTAFVATTQPDAIDRATAILRRELDALDLACSRFRTDSEISGVHRAAGRPVVVSPLLADALAAALDVAQWTAGVVDPTVGAAVIGLGYDRDFAAVPSDIAAATTPAGPVPGWWCVDLDTEHRVVRVPAGVVLDLGATAKAFAADRAADRIAEDIGPGVVVNLGGDIAVRGAPAGGWGIGLALDCATAPGDAPVVVSVERGGLASSGTTVRAWRTGGRPVHHIVDPHTGESADTCWALVSVAAPTCLEANAASTASVVWGADAVDRLTALRLPSRLVHHDGTVVTVCGWPPDTAPAERHPGEAA